MKFSTDKERRGLPPAKYYIMRMVLAIYIVADWAIWFKHAFFGPLNWSVRLRTFSITNEKSTTLGRDYTHIALPPDMTDLIPTIPGSAPSSLEHSFCQPSKYMYLLTAPISAAHSRIMSVHIFTFGSIMDLDGEDVETSVDAESVEWLECAILRRTATGIAEVPHPGRLPLSLHFRAKIKNRRPYGAVHVMNFSHALTQALRSGDRIGVWTRGHVGLVHEPSLAMVKVCQTDSTRSCLPVID
jgi:hypothetical protein